MRRPASVGKWARAVARANAPRVGRWAMKKPRARAAAGVSGGGAACVAAAPLRRWRFWVYSVLVSIRGAVRRLKTMVTARMATTIPRETKTGIL